MRSAAVFPFLLAASTAQLNSPQLSTQLNSSNTSLPPASPPPAAPLSLSPPTLSSSTVSTGLAPDYQYNYSDFAFPLRQWLLDQNRYDARLPPKSIRTGNASSMSGNSRSGTDVGIQIRFFKVKEVNLVEGAMSLKVWWRMAWYDDRLSWNPADWNGITQVPISQDETWTPDFGHYNAMDGVQNTLEESRIILSSNGRVYWSRPGMVDVMCKFSGLVQFPYDQLSCAFDVGGWMTSGGTQGLYLMNGGSSFSNSEPASGPSYQQFTIDRVTADIQAYTYPCCPSEPWPVASYRVYLNRHAYFYESFFLILIILTITSTLPAFMSWEVGERLGFGITLVLVVETMKTFLAEVLPVCGEMLWAGLLLEASEYTCLIALFETCVVLFLAFYTEEHILPAWVLAIANKVHSMCTCKKKDEEMEALEQQMEDEKESPSGIFYRQRLQKKEETEPTPSMPEMVAADKPTQPPPILGKRARSRLMLYEHLFFKMDVDGTGIVDNEEMKRFLAYANLEMDQEGRDAALMKADVTGDGNMVRWEFVLLCIDTLEYVPIDELKLALENYLMAISANDRRNEAHWKAAAKSLDMYTRFLLPLAYMTFVGVHYNTDYSDYYASQPTLPMFSGFGPSSMTSEGVGMATIVPIIAVVLLFSWWQAKMCAVKAKLIETKPSNSEIIAKKTTSFSRQNTDSFIKRQSAGESSTRNSRQHSVTFEQP